MVLIMVNIQFLNFYGIFLRKALLDIAFRKQNVSFYFFHQNVFLESLDATSLDNKLINKIKAVRITAAAYALAFTSGIGDPSWKKIAKGRVATGSPRLSGI